MREMTAPMQSLIRWIRGEKALDPAVDAVDGVVTAATRPAAVKNALSGSWLGHQLHPVLTDLPIGAWGAATALDVLGGETSADAARRLVGLGSIASAATAMAGFSDWSSMYGPDKRVGLVHGLSNGLANALQTTSWFVRGRGHRGVGIALSLMGLGITLASAYIGGHLSFVRGVGVNRTAFQDAPREWTDVAADTDLAEGSLTRVMAGDIPVMLARQDGEVLALSAVCTHAGGPLDEGTLDEDGCVTCPWHGSRFRLHDGAVQRGPASVPEPRWDVRVDDGRVSVRAAQP